MQTKIGKSLCRCWMLNEQAYQHCVEVRELVERQIVAHKQETGMISEVLLGEYHKWYDAGFRCLEKLSWLERGGYRDLFI